MYSYGLLNCSKYQVVGMTVENKRDCCCGNETRKQSETFSSRYEVRKICKTSKEFK